MTTFFTVMILLLGTLYVDAAEVVRLRPDRMQRRSMVQAGPCQILFLNHGSIQHSLRERNIATSLKEIIRSGAQSRDWESEDSQTGYFYSYMAPGMPRLSPTLNDSVIAHASRSGRFIAIQVVRPFYIFDVVEVIEMMRRFGDPLVVEDNIGIEVWFGERRPLVDVLRYATSAPDAEPSSMDKVAEDLHERLRKTGLLSVREDMGVHHGHIVSKRGGAPSLVWSSVRMSLGAKSISATRLNQLVQQIRNSAESQWSVDIGEAP